MPLANFKVGQGRGRAIVKTAMIGSYLPVKAKSLCSENGPLAFLFLTPCFSQLLHLDTVHLWGWECDAQPGGPSLAGRRKGEVLGHRGSQGVGDLPHAPRCLMWKTERNRAFCKEDKLQMEVGAR